MIAHLGSDVLGAHAIAINLDALVFMLPLGIEAKPLPSRLPMLRVQKILRLQNLSALRDLSWFL